MRVGLIGFGSIGRRVATLAAADGRVEISAALVRDVARHSSAATELGVPLTDTLDGLLDTAPDVVAEVAGHGGLAQHGEQILRRGLTLVTTSAGLLADDDMRERLLAAAAAGNSRIVLPSGAIAGLDAIESANRSGLEHVRHVVRKPPDALFEDPVRVAEVMAAGVPVILYDGPAREAVRLFPANVNVVAMVSLAGLGFERTTAVVVADPAVIHNTHEVTAEGTFGRVEILVQNVPSAENPKTGLIVAGSVMRTLDRLSSTLNVGG